MGCWYPLGEIVSRALRKCNGHERWRGEDQRMNYAMAYPPTETHFVRPGARTVTFSGTNSVHMIPPSPQGPQQQAPAPQHQAPPPQHEPDHQHQPEQPQPAPEQGAPPPQAEQPRQPKRGKKKPSRRVRFGELRPRPTTTTAAAAAAATPTAGERAEQRRRRQRAWSSGSRPGGGPSAPSGPRAAGVLPVHAVAAAEVGGDAAAARVLLGGVPVQLPDAGAGGHLQPRHRRQQAHHHLQRGEPQRLRHRLISAMGGQNRTRFPRRTSVA